MHVSSFESKYGPLHQLSTLKCDFRSFYLRFTHAQCFFFPFLNSVYDNIVHFKKLLFAPFCLKFSCCLSFPFFPRYYAHAFYSDFSTFCLFLLISSGTHEFSFHAYLLFLTTYCIYISKHDPKFL